MGDAAEYKISEERAAILSVLGDAGEPMTPTEVADALEKKVGATKKAMWTMAREGQLKSAGGRYSMNSGNLGNPVTEGGKDGRSVTENDVPGNPPGNPIRERKPHTNGESDAAVTRLPGLPQGSNLHEEDGASVTERVTGPVTGGNRRLTAEESEKVKRLIRQGMKPALARAKVISEEGGG